ncbi:MAG: hypothetical protein JF607_17270 [Burkholderiales bacterium]|jgi:hypothetical protein|nr:hypothetical protein [Burkholderiales bacterium]
MNASKPQSQPPPHVPGARPDDKSVAGEEDPGAGLEERPSTPAQPPPSVPGAPAAPPLGGVPPH